MRLQYSLCSTAASCGVGDVNAVAVLGCAGGRPIIGELARFDKEDAELDVKKADKDAFERLKGSPNSDIGLAPAAFSGLRTLGRINGGSDSS